MIPLHLSPTRLDTYRSYIPDKLRLSPMFQSRTNSSINRPRPLLPFLFLCTPSPYHIHLVTPLSILYRPFVDSDQRSFHYPAISMFSDSEPFDRARPVHGR